METHDVTRMRLVGGNLALDFVNTRSGPPDGPPDDDVLTGYPDLLAWAVHVGSLGEAEAAQLLRSAERRSAEAEAAFARSLGARDYLDELFRPLTRGAGPAATALGRLQRDEADAIAHAQFEPGRHFGWTWLADTSLDRPLRPIVHAAVELLKAADLDRVKACGGCRFLFYDESKNRSRRWCSMDDCGTEEKMRRYVAARRTRSRPSAD